MDHFNYREGELYAEDVALADLAEIYGTPFYCVSQATLEHHYRVLDHTLMDCEHQICYAPKANASLAVLEVLARLGAGADVVSEGECRLALAAGVPASVIVFSGVGKTRAEMAFVLRAGIGQINVESPAELLALDAVAQSCNTRAPIAFRVNPDVDAGSHSKISTGRAGDKFGIPFADARALYAQAEALPGIRVVGVDMHIGSQLPALAPFEKAFWKLRKLADQLRGEGHEISTVDIGGGVGACYGDGVTPPTPEQYGALVGEVFGDAGYRIVLEPGRMIAANAGVLVARVLYLKQSQGQKIVVVDAGMNDLMRPSLYDAYHEIVPLREVSAGQQAEACDVVGPVCETSDTFAKNRMLAPVQEGDCLVMRSVGAYGASMASEYNARLRIAETMVSGDRHALTRARGTYSEMLARERRPAWLE